MKKILLLTALISLAITACRNNKDVPDAYGTFEATEVTVSAQATGRITWLNLEEGQQVDSEVQIGLIDTTDLMLKKSQTREQQIATATRRDDLSAQIAVQEQNKTNLMVDKTRIEKLLKDGAATQKQLDDVNAGLNLVDKQIASIKSQFAGLAAQVSTYDKQIAQVDKSIQDAVIKNPVRGTVLAKYAEPGEITSYGKPLYRIADLSSLILRVYISGSQLSKVKIGQKVEVRYDTGENSLGKVEGTVTWISPTAEFTPKTIQTREERVNLVYAVKVMVSNTGNLLKIGMPGEIRLLNQ